jgi:hypothetical protein
MPYLGEITSLLAAVCWTVSSTAFAVASRAASPLAANHFRLYASLPMLALLAAALLGSPWPFGATGGQYAAAVASGLCGLVLGDIGYFYALAKIGPRLCSVIMVSWPVVVVVIEAAQGRAPGSAVLAGIGVTMMGVVLVLLRSRDESRWDPRVTPRQRRLGVLGAVLGSVGQAAGFVFAGPAMAVDGEALAMAPLHCTVVRMATACVVMQAVAIAQGQGFAMREVLARPAARRSALLGAAFGPIGGVWLSMFARQQAEQAGKVGVSAALMATTPLFMMPVAWKLYGAPIGWLGVLGTLLAVGGVTWCLLAT